MTAAVRSCPKSQEGVAEGSADTDACWIIENVTLTGTTPNEAIYGVAANWIFVDPAGAENDGDTQELIVRCNGAVR